jgi:hypothetical protein
VAESDTDDRFENSSVFLPSRPLSSGGPQSAIKRRKDTSALFREACLYGVSTAGLVTRLLSGGDEIRTHGPYIANVVFDPPEQALSKELPGWPAAIPSAPLTKAPVPSR